MSEKVELKPCPFCGGKAAIGTLFHSRDNMVKYTMKCSGCGVLTPLYKTKKSQKGMEQENRRMKEFKPCPFCGGEAKCYDYAPTWATTHKWVVECSICGATTKSYKTKKRAIEAWNRRNDVDDD